MNKFTDAMRKMTLLDIEQVMAIEQDAYPHPWTPGIFNDCLRVGYHCYAYEVDGAIRGYAIMSRVMDEVHILNVCIARPYQKQGFGLQLMNFLLQQARQFGATTAYLEVRVSNHQAIRLYQGMGFNEIGIRKNYYPANKGKEDAQLFACELTVN